MRLESPWGDTDRQFRITSMAGAGVRSVDERARVSAMRRRGADRYGGDSGPARRGPNNSRGSRKSTRDYTTGDAGALANGGVGGRTGGGGKAHEGVNHPTVKDNRLASGREGPLDGNQLPSPETYRIDSAGHRVPYGEPWFVVTKMTGSRAEWRQMYCERCWRGE